MQTEQPSVTLALHEAVKNDDTDLITQLLSDGAKIDERNETGDYVLHIAATSSPCHVVRMLLKNGADPNVKNNRGDSPLHVAATRTLCHVVRMLLKNGADPNVKNNRGDSPLHSACYRHWDNGRKTIVKELLLHGAHVNAINNVNLTLSPGGGYETNNDFAGGTTPLHFAIGCAHIDEIEILLAHGADISIQEGEGYNSLHWAVQYHTNAFVSERNRNHANPRRRATTQKIEKAVRVVQILLTHQSDTSGKIARLQAQTLYSKTAEGVAFTPNMKEILRSAMETAQEERRSKLRAFTMGHHARLGAASHISALDPEVIQMIMDRV
jgi:ankyrin repeat protein